jgi:cell division protein FtsW
MFAKKMDYRRLKTPAFVFGAMSVVMMLLVAVYFIDARSHRWIRLGAVSLQPSEFAKPALVLFLAFFVTWRGNTINDRANLKSAALALAMLAIAIIVPDLGTAIVLVATAAVVFFVAGLKVRYLVASALVAACLASVAVVARPYRLARVIGYVDPDYTLLDRIDSSGRIKKYMHSSLATRDTSYQVRQSLIAVGAGGPLGVGLMNGKQKLLYLPEAHTDFIYAVIGEELGLWGTTGVLIGFLIILTRGLQLFWIAPDAFGRYLALGVVTSIFIQAMINMSVVLDLGPTKGIPLPMISHGGSSLLSTLLSLGMLLSVSDQSA